MKKIIIRHRIEIHDNIAIIDPSREGLEVKGERIEGEDAIDCMEKCAERIKQGVLERLEYEKSKIKAQEESEESEESEEESEEENDAEEEQESESEEEESE